MITFITMLEGEYKGNNNVADTWLRKKEKEGFKKKKKSGWQWCICSGIA